jgi:CheY-like chemotaxis protein
MDQLTAVAAAAPARILMVEDERIVAASIGLCLEREGYVVAGNAGSAERAIALAAELKPDLILMDINLGGGPDGVEAAREIQKAAPVPVIFLTAYSDSETLARAGAVTPFGYLVKPVEDRALRPAIEMALYRHRAEREREALLAEVERLRALLPVCGWCRKVKTDDGYWLELMDYLSERLGATVTHGICVDCFEKMKHALPDVK